MDSDNKRSGGRKVPKRAASSRRVSVEEDLNKVRSALVQKSKTPPSFKGKTTAETLEASLRDEKSTKSSKSSQSRSPKEAMSPNLDNRSLADSVREISEAVSELEEEKRISHTRLRNKLASVTPTVASPPDPHKTLSGILGKPQEEIHVPFLSVSSRNPQQGAERSRQRHGAESSRGHSREERSFGRNSNLKARRPSLGRLGSGLGNPGGINRNSSGRGLSKSFETGFSSVNKNSRNTRVLTSFRSEQSDGRGIQSVASNPRLTVNNARPKVARHATQLDMLRKLKRMAPFTREAEHEFLVNMYKLRGTFISHGQHEEQNDTGNKSASRKDSSQRRASFTANVFDRVSTGKKFSMAEDQVNHLVEKAARSGTIIEKYSDPHTKVILPRQVGNWEGGVAILVVVQVLILPYIIAFDPPTGVWYDAMELCVDIVFVIDMLIQLNLAYKTDHFKDTESTISDEEDYLIFDEVIKLETRRKYILRHYIWGWFTIDFLAIVPLFLTVGGYGGTGQSLGLAKTLRFPRLFRLLKVARVFRNLRSNSKLRRFLLYSKYTSVFRLFGWILLIIVMNHFVTCIWFAFTHQSMHEHTNAEIATEYVHAFYQSVLLMNGEHIELNTDGEKLLFFILVVMLSIFVAIMFAEVSMIFQSVNANSQKYRRKMTELYEAMETMNLPVALQERVLQFYDFIWSKHHTLNGKSAMYDFMGELSPNLAKEIQMCTYKEMLVGVSFFREFTADVIHRLVMSLESKMFMPKDYVISVGECGTDMFFIEYGKCEIFLNHVHIRTLSKNDYFGEIALITDVRRTASVQSSTYLQVVCLSRENFEYCAEEMTLESRKRVLAHILKAYQGKDILQRCSEPDFVYEDTEKSTRDDSSENLDTFDIGDDVDHHFEEYEYQENNETEKYDSAVSLQMMQRMEIVENSIETMSAKMDKLMSMNIKMLATTDMWKSRINHDMSNDKIDLLEHFKKHEDLITGKSTTTTSSNDTSASLQRLSGLDHLQVASAISNDKLDPTSHEANPLTMSGRNHRVTITAFPAATSKPTEKKP